MCRRVLARTVVLVLSLLAMGGCAALDLGKYVSSRGISEQASILQSGSSSAVVEGAPDFARRVNAYAASVPLSADEKRLLAEYPGLLSLKLQVDGKSLPNCRPFPDELAASSVTRALVHALQQSVQNQARELDPNHPVLSTKFSRADAKTFTELLSRRVLHPDEFVRALPTECQEFFAWSANSTLPLPTAPAGLRPMTKTLTLTTYLVEYFKAYVKGNFVDHQGGKIAKPTFINGIGNEAISSSLTVLLEAIADYALATPVFIASYDAAIFTGGFIPLNSGTLGRCISGPVKPIQLGTDMTPAKPAGGEKIKVSNASQVPFRSGIVEITTGASRERIRIEDRDDVNNELTVADNGRGADGTKAIGHAVGDGVSVPDQFFVADDVAVNANAWAPGCLTTAFVFSTAQTFLTTGGAQPTAAAVDSALVARAATVGAQHKKQRCTNPGGAASCANISQKEVDTISYVSGKAGTGAQVAGGAVFRAFGGLELSFVIGGHFAIGNNDTVAKIVDTVLEVVTRRAVEHATYLVLESSAVEVTVP